MEESDSVTPDYATKLQLSKQYDAGTETKYISMDQDRNARDTPPQPWSPNL